MLPAQFARMRSSNSDYPKRPLLHQKQAGQAAAPLDRLGQGSVGTAAAACARGRYRATITVLSFEPAARHATDGFRTLAGNS